MLLCGVSIGDVKQTGDSRERFSDGTLRQFRVQIILYARDPTILWYGRRKKPRFVSSLLMVDALEVVEWANSATIAEITLLRDLGPYGWGVKTKTSLSSATERRPNGTANERVNVW